MIKQKENIIKLNGIIKFDPADRTNKHLKQSSWKKVAMVLLEDNNIQKGICEYYAWFIKKRYSINLLKPLRGAHVTFINDRASDITGDWESVKKKWNNKHIDIYLNVDPRTDSAEEKGKITYNWWLNVPHEKKDGLHSIRKELGLEKPFFGLHMTIGRAVNFVLDGKFENNAVRAKEMNIEQSIYIHTLIKKGFLK